MFVDLPRTVFWALVTVFGPPTALVASGVASILIYLMLISRPLAILGL